MTTLVANTFEIVGLHGIANFFKRIGAELKRRRRIRQTINELSKLTNHELNDIGIARGDIYSIARQDMDMKQSHLIAPFNPNLRGFV